MKLGHLWIAALLVSPALACRAAVPLPSESGTGNKTMATSAVDVEGAACPLETASIIHAADSEDVSFAQFPAVDTSSELYLPLVTYTVQGDKLSEPVLETVPQNLVPYQKDFAQQQSAWRLFAGLIPVAQRTMLRQFQIVTDGPGGVLSAVEQTREDPDRWILETDIADIPDAKNLTFTLLHEFGHLLTLSSTQVPPDLRIFEHPTDMGERDRASEACTSYFPGEGCSLPGSYINSFFDRFWRDVYPEWSAIDRVADNNRRVARLESFYRKHHDQFVNSYAVTSPVEDIAESWAFFVLAPEPSGNFVRDEKLRFFAQYPELQELRAQILESLCTLDP